MNAFFALTIVCGLFQMMGADRYERKYYGYNPVESTTTTTTQKTTRQTYRPEDLPATSDFPPSPNPPRICPASMACGWAVYDKFTRRVEYFTRNVCVCAQDQSCLRVDDDLAISAYVFKCGPKQATTEEYVLHW